MASGCNYRLWALAATKGGAINPFPMSQVRVRLIDSSWARGPPNMDRPPSSTRPTRYALKRPRLEGPGFSFKSVQEEPPPASSREQIYSR
ncbi:hypothetical protein HJFPF1_00580 [Paramyrothecium foliicola]|nr:hypothetical protein HJFPF1_00580 [Paramyrothecium foliicola]